MYDMEYERRKKFTTGQLIEEDNANAFIRWGNGKGQNFTYNFSETELKNPKNRKLKEYYDKMDKEQGTDIITDMDYHIDLTGNFSRKPNMPFMIDTGIPVCPNAYYPELSEQTIKIGIRTGNNHNGYTDFDEPVAVVGFDLSDKGIYEKYSVEISENIAKNIDKIMAYVKDGMMQYQAGEEDYEYLEDDEKPLRKNPNYMPNKKANESRFAELNAFVEQMLDRDISDKEFDT